MSYCGGILLLIWKNFRQETRRPIGLAFEVISPLLLFAILGLLRQQVDVVDQPINYGLSALEPSYHTSQPNFETKGSFRVLGDLLCYTTFFNGRLIVQDAGFLAVSPKAGSNTVVDQVLAQMEQDWVASRAKWLPILSTPTNGAAFNLVPGVAASLSAVNVTSGFTPKYQGGSRDTNALQNVATNYAKCGYLTATWSDIVRRFSSSAELDTYMSSSFYSTGTWTSTTAGGAQRPVAFAIDFDNPTSIDKISYTLRGNSSSFPTTDPQVPYVDKFERSWDAQYFSLGFSAYKTGGFVNMQLIIDQAITELNAGASMADYAFGTFAFPAAAYKTDTFFGIAAGLLPLFWVLVFLYPYFVIVGNLVAEKSSRIKEGLKMMGSTSTQFWLSTYLYYFIKFSLISGLATLVAQALRVFIYSDPFIIFLWFDLYMMSLVASAVLLSTLFDNPRTASMISLIVLMVLFFLNGVAANFDNETQSNLLCLSAPACFAISSGTWATYESGLIGLGWNNIHEEVNFLRFRSALLMMFGDILIYTFLALYLEKVVPSDFGQSYPWYFIFDPNFWFPQYMKEYYQNRDGIPALEANPMDPKFFQKVGEDHGKPVIEVRDLVKEFGMGIGQPPFTAVKGINVDIYEDQIFCLLGHNGAGKTTTINMLTGMLNISAGAATIHGSDVETDMNSIRDFLGVCPQHDVLWDKLTVREHLEFFAGLKGVPKADVKAQAAATIEEIGLSDRATFFPTQLSGGQKRKLSLGIALIGGSKVVFLDEPTSGMDPASRRDAWGLIKRARKGRCIILTTHFMDEADLLGDRIAIMAHGRIKCVGSSLFLKKLYGVGYSFAISLNASVSAQGQEQRIMSLVKDHVDTADVVSSHGAELVVRLPFDQSKHFASLFRDVETSSLDLGIDSYGISVTTLEEVFIQVGTTDEDENEVGTSKIGKSEMSQVSLVADEEKDDDKPVSPGDEENNADPLLVDPDSPALERKWSEMLLEIRERSQKQMWGKHFIAMLSKKMNYSKRDRRVLLCQVFCPLLFFVFAFSIIGITRNARLPRLAMTTGQFGGPADYKIPHNAPTTNTFVTGYGSLTNTIGQLEPLTSTPSADMLTHMKAYADRLLATKGIDTKRRYNGFALFNETISPGIAAELSIAISLGQLRFPFEFTNATQLAIYQSIVANQTTTIPINNYMLIGANASARHGFPVSANIASNMLLRRYAPQGEIKIFAEPLPTTVRETEAAATFNGFFYAILIGMGLAFFPVGPMYNIVFERESLTKHQQLVSGANFVVYWAASYLWDSITVLPASIGGMLFAMAWQVDVFTGDAQGVFFLIIFLYGFGIISFSYMFSWVFKNAQRAQYISLSVYILAGWAFALAAFIMDIISSTQEVNKTLKGVYRIFPSYVVTNTLQNLALRKFGFSPANIPVNASAWHWDVSGYNCVILALHSVGYFLVTLVIEYVSTIPSVLALFGFSPNAEPPKEELDADVTDEQDKIRQRMRDDGTIDLPDPVVLAGLRKVYSSQTVCQVLSGHEPSTQQLNVAVKDIYYTVPRGQVFGFLGVNGAGKTSTLSMLSGRFPPSHGNAWINQIPISNQLACRRMIGYCPQFDALFDLLTAREHLFVYGTLKGLEPSQIEAESEVLIDQLTLGKYADRAAGTYSGGNKRKLSVAIAMIGSPPIVFLDEPSTGMDPVSRRCMWDYISSTMHGRSVVLTTHSMEECEALCHRIGIMVSGQLRCLGTAQHLKSKFGKGYQLDITLDPQYQGDYERGLLDRFPETILLERHDMNVTYRIEGTEDFSLADMFEALEELNENVELDSYSLNQTSLEQIFIQMATPDVQKAEEANQAVVSSVPAAGTAQPTPVEMVGVSTGEVRDPEAHPQGRAI